MMEKSNEEIYYSCEGQTSLCTSHNFSLSKDMLPIITLAGAGNPPCFTNFTRRQIIFSQNTTAFSLPKHVSTREKYLCSFTGQMG
jgi:hypothetical protein